MRVMKIADVARSSTAGMSGVMVRTGSELELLGHSVEYLFRPDLLSARCPPRVRRFAVPFAVCLLVYRHQRRRRLDLVEVHEPIAGPYAFLAGTRWGRRRLPPCVVLSHGLEERCWKALLQCRSEAGIRTSGWSRISVPATLLSQANLALRRACHVIVLNQADHAHLVSNTGLPVERVSLVPNGVEECLLAIERRPASYLRVLFLGSWLERKGVNELYRSWPEVLNRFPSAQLTLAGVGTTSALDAFPVSCRASVAAIPTFAREDLPAILANHDVLVLPSWFEGMPLVALEAAAAAMAVVATEIPGVIDIFRRPDPALDGAILVGCVCPEALTSALCRLAAEPALLVQLQEAARRRASGFTWAASGIGYAEAYRKALADASA